ncbi:MAG: hypothetical protein OIF50_13440 [Flavobacteriaceae bacterium]|nr:hypothetical protein [Flavobacteriaceae bacterium]
MKHRLYIGILLIASLFGCAKKQTQAESMLQYHPRQLSFILRTDNLQSLKSAVKTNEVLQEFSTIDAFKIWQNQLEYLAEIAPDKEVVLSYSSVGQNNIELCFSTKSNNPIANHFKKADSSKISKYEQKDIHSYFYRNQVLHSTRFDSILVGSSSKLLLENLIRAKGKYMHYTKLEKLFNQIKPNKLGTLFVHTDKVDAMLQAWQQKKKPSNWAAQTQWLALDIDLISEGVLLHGIASKNDSIPRQLDLLHDNNNESEKLQSYLPIDLDEVSFYHFSDFEQVDRVRQQYLKKVVQNDSLLHPLEEMAIAKYKEQQIVAMSFFADNHIADFLQTIQNGTTLYRNVTIHTLGDSHFLQNKLTPLLQNFEANYSCVIEDAFVFTSDKASIEHLISNYQNGATLHKNNTYVFAKNSLSETNSLFQYQTGTGLKNQWIKRLQPKEAKALKKTNLKNYHLSQQFVDDQNFFHAAIQLHKNPKSNQQNIIAQKFSVQLDADILGEPQFVTNHRSKKKEIVIQDITHNLYLISTNGKVLWKKALDGPIQGKIQQVDLYKNGKLQLAFNTNNQWIILDRNGEIVAPFQKKFKGGNLSPLAVFDYENNKNYRFVFSQGNQVYMFDDKGKTVSGFDFNSTANLIGTPKHFRYKGKDYILMRNENGKLFICNRRGAIRIPIQKTFEFSENDIYWYKNAFSFSNKKGELIQINEKGKISKKNMGIPSPHFIDATAKSLAALNSNQLYIKSNKVDLPIGVYSEPKFFYLYDKIYVSTTDMDNQKTYLFDSRGKSIANFPIFGIGPATIDDMEKDRKLELLVKSSANTLVVYQLY